MADAYIINQVITQISKTIINNLLAANNFKSIYVSPIKLSGVNLGTDIGVLLMPVDNTEIIYTDNTVKALAMVGVRVIGVWMPGAAGAQLPASMNKFGYSTICVNSGQAKAVLSGLHPIWEDSNCDERPDEPVPRNKCK